MGLFAGMKSADTLLKLLRGDLDGVLGYDFIPDKPDCVRRVDPIPTAVPERLGVSSRLLAEFLGALQEERCGVHAVMILRRGRTIAKAAFAPYQLEIPHQMYSLSKSITGMAVGLAIEDGLLTLDTKLIELFKDKTPKIHGPRLAQLTVRHLLTMTAGIRFDETGSIRERDWISAYLSSDFLFAPGEHFQYNSMNSYMLSAAVTRVTGRDLCDYLNERIFRPLGLSDLISERCPEQIVKGGWGMYLSVADMARLGQLFLENGSAVVKGKRVQLLPADYVQAATRPQIVDKGCPEGYGYQLWFCGWRGSYQFNGIFGQQVFVIPELEMVIALTGGTNHLFTEGRTDTIVRRFFESAVFGEKLRPSTSYLLLRNMERELYSEPLFYKKTTFNRSHPSAALTKQLQNCNYQMDGNFGSLLPFVLQAVHGNFSLGCSEIKFRLKQDVVTLTVTEGECKNTVSFGLRGRAVAGEVAYRGERYKVAGLGRFSVDEDGREVFAAALCFLETPNTRRIKFFFEEDRVRIKFDEQPSAIGAVDMLFELIGGKDATAGKLFSGEAIQEHMRARLLKLMKPRCWGEIKK